MLMCLFRHFRQDESITQMNIRQFVAFFILSGLCLTSLTHSAADEPKIEYDVVYGEVDGTELHMDIAVPAKQNNAKQNNAAPCIVVIHGGAWTAGNKKDHLAEIKHFSKHGYVSVSIEYRLCPKHQFPAQIEDTKCAIRYLRANASQYGIHPGKIGALGFSAGAHLSMLLGTMGPENGLEGKGGWPDQSSKVQAVVSFYGPTKLDATDIPKGSVPLVSAFIGGSQKEKQVAYRQASPLTYVSSGDAPMLLFHGTKDPLVPHNQSTKMATAMTRHNIPGRVELLLNAGHGWGDKESERTRNSTLAFFGKHLRD